MARQWTVKHWSIKMVHMRPDKKGLWPSNFIGTVLHDYLVDFYIRGCFPYLHFNAVTIVSTVRRWRVDEPSNIDQSEWYVWVGCDIC